MTITAEVVGVAPLTLSEAGSWLCDRHSQLRELVEQIGAWQAGMPVMHQVRDALIEYDRRRATEPDWWHPNIADPIHQLWLMAPSEIGRLRLLATLAPRRDRGNVQFTIEDLSTFDAVGKDLIEDWLRCVRIGVLG